METSIETITPHKAAEWLSRNIGNRPQHSRMVPRFAQAMLDGAWRLNGESIKFAADGTLIDGQHRLLACIEAGVPFSSMVIRGLDRNVFSTLDQNTKRTASDTFSINGEVNTNTLSAACLLIRQVARKKLGYADPMRIDQAANLLKANPGIRDCTAFAVSNRCTFLSTSICAALLFLFRKSCELVGDEFMTNLIVGENLERGMPEFALREKLIDNAAQRRKFTRVAIVKLCIKAWNYKYDGKNITRLTLSEQEPMAVVAGFDYENFVIG